jgi:hypothetical protein
MQLQQVRSFLAVLQERIHAGGQALRRLATFADKCHTPTGPRLGRRAFKRKPEVALTVRGHAVHPYMQRIAEDADLARDTAQALVTVADHRAASVEQLATWESLLTFHSRCQWKQLVCGTAQCQSSLRLGPALMRIPALSR